MLLIVLPCAGVSIGAIAFVQGVVGPGEALAAIVQVYFFGFPLALVVLLFNGEISRLRTKRKGRSEVVVGVAAAVVAGAGLAALQAPNPILVLVAASVSLLYGLLAEALVPWPIKDSASEL
ncbi:MAG: hypothetical protein ACRDGN_12765 [bacterium]